MADKSKTVLIVDDERLNLNILVELLEGDYTILVAKNGSQALKRASDTPTPDIILLDIMMPGINGYEVMARLQKNPATREIPVIFVTALEQSADETRGFELGAADYIRKPFNPAVVKARINTQLALREAYQNLEDKNQQLLYERSIMENIILTMRNEFPKDMPDIQTLITPLEKTTGDIILAAPRPDGVLHLLVGDVTGHGLTAAICAPMVDHLFVQMSSKNIQPEEIIQAINQKLNIRLPTGLYMACAFLEWNRANKNVRLWNYNLPEAMCLRDGALFQTYPSKRPPLGVMPTVDDQCHYEFQATADDRMIICSDGVVETANAGGEIFGSQRLAKELVRLPIERLPEILQIFRGDVEQSDDITLLALTC